ncbi:MAG: hypothetical protein ACOCW1_04925 [Chitinispirillaceae bacterium]
MKISFSGSEKIGSAQFDVLAVELEVEPEEELDEDELFSDEDELFSDEGLSAWAFFL